MYTLSRWLRCHGGFHGSTDNSDIPAATVEKSVKFEPVFGDQAVTDVVAANRYSVFSIRYLYLFL